MNGNLAGRLAVAPPEKLDLMACSRDWSAWSVGTMTQHDFDFAAERRGAEHGWGEGGADGLRQDAEG